MSDTKPTQQDIETGIRDSLKDFVVLAKKLAPTCTTTEELIGVMECAVENDGQLRLLMAYSAATNQKR